MAKDEFGPYERESEFTGLKGQLLRYLGSWYVLVLAALFVEALAQTHWIDGTAETVFHVIAALLTATAIIAYPVRRYLLNREE